MKLTILVISATVVTFLGHLPLGHSGVLTFTSKGIQYLNNEQFAALQDPNGVGSQGGLWRGDGSQANYDSGPPPEVQEYDDDEEDEDEDDDEYDDEEGNDGEDQEDESEEKDVAFDDEKEDASYLKTSKYTISPKLKVSKTKKSSKKSSKTKKTKDEKSQESSDEEVEADDEAEDDDKPKPPPPMPDVLKHAMSGQYNPEPNGYPQYSSYEYPPSGYPQADYSPSGYSEYPETPTNPPFLSRMTSYITSLLGRGSNPVYMNRNAKALPDDASDDVQSPVEVISRKKRQVKLREVEIRPFYHVRNNIRTMVRRQPSTKLAPQPVDDFSNLSEKRSKPIKLFMEPYSAPQTYQNPPINPAQGVRGPSSSGTPNPGGLSNPGALGQGVPQQSSSSNSGGGSKKGSSGGNKNNRNKQSSNKAKDKDSEEDSDEEYSDEDQYQYSDEDESYNFVPTWDESYEDGLESLESREDYDYYEDYE